MKKSARNYVSQILFNSIGLIPSATEVSMSKDFEKCVVVDGQIYCWDEEQQKPVAAKLVQDRAVSIIPEKALNALFEKILAEREIAV